jgi:hypothetical protein
VDDFSEGISERVSRDLRETVLCILRSMAFQHELRAHEVRSLLS